MSTFVMHTHTPGDPLDRFIACFWYVKGHVHYVREKVLPMTTIELMVNLGPPQKVVNKEDYSRFVLYKQSWISGLQTEYIIIEPLADTEILGIRFKPGGAYPFLGIPVCEVHNHVVEMDLIWGSFIREVCDRVGELPNVMSKFQTLEQILRRRYDVRRYDQRWCIVRAATSLLANPHNPPSIHAVSDRLGLSPKHLIHLFQQAVGVSPKQFQRVARFNHVLDAIDPAQPIDWTTLAHAHHYYDQAHFNRDFVAFTGASPGEYMAQRRKWFGDNLERGDNIHFIPLG